MLVRLTSGTFTCVCTVNDDENPPFVGLAPPCVQHTRSPWMAACLHGLPVRELYAVQRGARQVAYIFSDRIIGRSAMKNLAKFERGLGHLLAHEVGHLMSADWHPRDPRVQTLTAEQASVIRQHATTPQTR